MGFKQRRDRELAAEIHAKVPAALLENRAWHWHGVAREQRRPPLANLARAVSTPYPGLKGTRHRAAQLIPAALQHVDLSTAAEGLSVERGYAKPKVDAPAATRAGAPAAARHRGRPDVRYHPPRNGRLAPDQVRTGLQAKRHLECTAAHAVLPATKALALHGRPPAHAGVAAKPCCAGCQSHGTAKSALSTST